MQMRLVNDGENRSHIALACASLVFVVVAGACALYTQPGASLRVQKPANLEIVRWLAPRNIVVSENRIAATESAAASIFEPVPMERSTADLEQRTHPAKTEQPKDEAVIQAGPKLSIAELAKTIPVPILRPHELADDTAGTSISGAEDRGSSKGSSVHRPLLTLHQHTRRQSPARHKTLETHSKASRVLTTNRQRCMTFQGVRSTCPMAPNWRHIQDSAICWTTLIT